MARKTTPKTDPYIPTVPPSTASTLPFLPRLTSYFQPLLLLSISIYYLPYTLLYHPFLLLTSPSTFRSKWFDNFWRVIGPQMALSPLQVSHIEELMSRAHGTVLELGPGNGDQTYHLKSEKISHCYAAEPNAFLHERLLSQATAHGLGAKYTTLECGAQPDSLLPALKAAGLLSTGSGLPEGGVFDSIIAIKSLCSAPRTSLPATVSVIQSLLKPGGEFLFFEHVENDRDYISRCFAWCLDLFIWPAMMGGCRMDGRVDKICLGMGGWEEKDIRTTPEFQGYEVFRYVRGKCVKAGS